MKTKTPRQARADAQAKLEAIAATVEARALERTLALIESPQPVVVPWNDYPSFDEYSMGPSYRDRPYYWSSLEDRTEGRWLPLYETPTDLRRMRADSRRMLAMFPIAEGALESLTNYIFGSGFEFTVQAKPGTQADEFAKLVQGVVDKFVEYNDLQGILDREIHAESRIEGEAFITLYPDDEHVRIELTGPDSIVEPANPRPLEQMLNTAHKLNGWWHGVHTTYCGTIKNDNAARPLGYHAVFDRHGDQWDYLPASRVEHIKRNAGRKARRGWSDFAIVQRDLELEGKIRRNTAEGAAILAAIVMIRQHAPGVTKSSIESMVSNNATATYDRQTASGARSTNVEQMRPGTIKDIPNGMEATVGPLGTLRSPVYIEVAQYLLRIIGHRWNMPEYMISGDASNANYSSTMVAESPFVKAREHDQAFYAKHFERIIWKALKIYHGAGMLGRVNWPAVRQAIAIKIDPPGVATRDALQQAQVNEILHANKILSKRTWATDSALDYDEELEEMASEPKEPPPIAQPFGQPSPFGGPMNPHQLAYEARRDAIAFSLMESADNCGTGDGGFKASNTCAGAGGQNAAAKPSSKQGKAIKAVAAELDSQLANYMRGNDNQKRIGISLVRSAREAPVGTLAHTVYATLATNVSRKITNATRETINDAIEAYLVSVERKYGL